MSLCVGRTTTHTQLLQQAVDHRIKMELCRLYIWRCFKKSLFFFNSLDTCSVVVASVGWINHLVSYFAMNILQWILDRDWNCIPCQFAENSLVRHKNILIVLLNSLALWTGIPVHPQPLWSREQVTLKLVYNSRDYYSREKHKRMLVKW